MLLVLTLTALVAAADPVPATDTSAPRAAAEAKPDKPPQTCTSRKVGRLFGHDVTHLKCEDAKPAPEKAASKPA